MLIGQRPEIPPSAITPPDVYGGRRGFLRAVALGAGAAGCGLFGASHAATGERTCFESVIPGSFSVTDEKPTAYASVTEYGNFYEFGPDKDSPGRNAYRLRTRPWTVSVEGWSAVISWVGFPLNELIRRCDVTGNAKFVEFWSLADPEQMPYVRLPFLDWPYVEALRLDEAMHPLALLGLGMYGEHMPKQNGAPLRVVVPWKYGFKGAKSIVKLRFVEKQPPTVWTKAAPDEYGFYSNVNPDVPHKRWSQSHERRLGEFFKRKTLPFNGYAEQVAGLYAGMDLRRNF
ncbi:MAG: protein-methionine-sulfoxide reductase catalytic subunit MsrP [Candidatus Dechloromonas phosphoritropha]|nr:protein-methionine-sulfoxide reductase catalytic subunit MsrP [Candidatus Dechloromonas phosphoritropha]MBP8787633.1 protein-methionine-sulfoxide reductase catalytic subunit MsrP [Azonexus sp.]MBP9227470.1 protein-methionine-sulfoxide reductase catalytic subunit MsrP [Azonexus sp.]